MHRKKWESKIKTGGKALKIIGKTEEEFEEQSAAIVDMMPVVDVFKFRSEFSAP